VAYFFGLPVFALTLYFSVFTLGKTKTIEKDHARIWNCEFRAHVMKYGMYEFSATRNWHLWVISVIPT